MHVKRFIYLRFLLSTTLVLVLYSAAAQTGTIKGSLRDAATQSPLEFATVQILKESASATDSTLVFQGGALSDSLGNFQVSGLSPGFYAVQVSSVGYETLLESNVLVTNSKPAILELQVAGGSTELEGVIITPSRFKKTLETPMGLRTIGVEEIRRKPGANRDISNVVQSLPGVVSTPSFRNDLIIRGGGPNENRFYLEGVELPVINHFTTQGASGGPVGMINVDFIKEVDFYSGAFPANYGNTISSIFDFSYIRGRDDRLGARFTVGASDVGLSLEGPAGEQGDFLFSARRSYLQFVAELVGLPFTPTYNDIQGKYTHRFNDRNKLTFIGIGAIDDFELNLDQNDTEVKQFLLDVIPVSPQWNYTTGIVYDHYGDKDQFRAVISRSQLDNRSEKFFKNDFDNPAALLYDYNSRETENKSRVEYRRFENNFEHSIGANFEQVDYFNDTFNRIFLNGSPLDIDYRSEIDFNKYGFFAQSGTDFFDSKLALSLGLRLDGSNYSEETSNPLEQFSPRLSAAYQISNFVSANFSAGRYYQLPPYTALGYRENDVLVNKANGVKYFRNDQVSTGVSVNTGLQSIFTAETYYKKYEDYPFLLRDQVTLANLGADFGVLGDEPVESTAEGRAYGLELLYQQTLYKGFYGIAAYTLGKSEYENAQGGFTRSSWDARHTVNLSGGKRLKRDWEIGINWRYQSGLPFSPFDPDSSLKQNWDITNGGLFDFEQLNTLESNALNQIDLRIDKKWFYPKWSLNLYLDVQNVTANTITFPVLILDRPLDADEMPIGGPIIENPNAPVGEQRYKVKEINGDEGRPLPTIGFIFEI